MDFNNFQQCLADFRSALKNLGIVTNGVANNYATWLRNIDAANGGNTLSWIMNSGTLQAGRRQYDNFVQANPSCNLTSNHLSAYNKFTQFILGQFNGDIYAIFALKAEEAAMMVAKAAIFVDLAVVNLVRNGQLGFYNIIARKTDPNYNNQDASWDYFSSTRYSSGKRRNNTPNVAIKACIRRSHSNYKPLDFTGYTTCHIYDAAKYQRYFACIPNLCLVPAGLKSLTDDYPEVKQMLEYHVYAKYGFLPANVPAPKMPRFYPRLKWR